MYIQPSSENWQGRIDSPADPLTARYHQKVQAIKLPDVSSKPTKRFGIVGFKCDEGVRRNKGRTGSAEGPDFIRKSMAKLPWHLADGSELIDAGDVKCEGKEMEKAQTELGNAVAQLLGKGIVPLILGGGHETFYGHYLGVRKHIGLKKKLGIINIDAHFDMRPYKDEPSSGTMFKQILDQDPNSSYFCAGIQKAGNTAALFREAESYGVEYISEENLQVNNTEENNERIQQFISKNDVIVLTLCSDVISSAYAPGVSAPSPFGLNPKVVRSLIRHIVSNEKTLSMDIAEVNPSLDENNKTVTLAAHIINEALLHFHSKTGAGE